MLNREPGTLKRLTKALVKDHCAIHSLSARAAASPGFPPLTISCTFPPHGIRRRSGLDSGITGARPRFLHDLTPLFNQVVEQAWHERRKPLTVSEKKQVKCFISLSGAALKKNYTPMRGKQEMMKFFSALSDFNPGVNLLRIHELATFVLHP